jgi:hypothetical protein
VLNLLFCEHGAALDCGCVFLAHADFLPSTSRNPDAALPALLPALLNPIIGLSVPPEITDWHFSASPTSLGG